MLNKLALIFFITLISACQTPSYEGQRAYDLYQEDYECAEIFKEILIFRKQINSSLIIQENSKLNQLNRLKMKTKNSGCLSQKKIAPIKEIQNKEDTTCDKNSFIYIMFGSC
ncbi:MAG: hypothetical protein ACTSXL_00760 [Alphaproteobacteria bacterium]